MDRLEITPRMEAILASLAAKPKTPHSGVQVVGEPWIELHDPDQPDASEIQALLDAGYLRIVDPGWGFFRAYLTDAGRARLHSDAA